MYRIELGPNDVSVFRSIEELAAGIRAGVITARARIYHQASDKWLPIEVHPHYRKALELVESGAAPAGEAGAPAPSPAASPPVAESAAGSPGGVSPSPAPRPAKPARESDAPAAPRPTIAGAPVIALPPDLPDEFVQEAIDPPSSHPDRASRSPGERTEPAEPPASPAQLSPRPVVRSRLRLRLSRRARRPVLLVLSGIVLALSTHLGLSSGAQLPHVDLGLSGLPFAGRGASKAKPAEPGAGRRSPAAAGRKATAAPARPRAAEPAGTPSFGGSSAFATPRYTPPLPESLVPAADRPPEIAPPPPESPVAPPLASGPEDALSAAALVARYQAAYAAARADLETGLRTAGFADLFAPAKLATPEGVRLGRLSVGTAAAYVARYRQREGEIERAYADSVRALTLRYGWSGAQRRPWETRRVLQEGPDVAKLAGFLLQSLDSLYGLLAAQEGRYRIADGRITFDDAQAARAYAELRPWLDRRAHAWADTASGPPTTAARILRAMGSAKLPEGGSL